MDYREAADYVRGLMERDGDLDKKIYVGRDGKIESVYGKLDEYILEEGEKDFSQEIIEVIRAKYRDAIQADAVGITINCFQDNEGFDAITVNLIYGVVLAIGDLIPGEKPLQ